MAGIVILSMAISYYQSNLAVTFLQAGSTFSLGRDGAYSEKFTVNSSTTIRGEFTATSAATFYIMNRSQFNSKFVPILPQNTVNRILGGYYLSTQFTLFGNASVTGSFNTNSSIALFVMNQTQFLAFANSGGQQNSSLYSQVGSSPLHLPLQAGTYNLVFDPISTSDTLMTVVQEFIATYSTPASFLHSSSSIHDAFTVSLDKGTYYLAWSNDGAFSLQVTVISSIGISR